MSRTRVAVLQIVAKQLTVTAAAAEYGISRRHLHRLLARYREGGLDALEPRSRRPRRTPIATPMVVRERVIELRSSLTAAGLDAGPVTIGWHLEQEGHTPPASGTISRILTQAGLINPQPRKRPRSSYTRFEMAQPNEMWQSDFIHWQLADGTDVEVLNWLNDHSRYLLSCTVHAPVTGDDVLATFLAVIDDHGAPQSTLTTTGGSTPPGSAAGATPSNTSSRSSASARRTARRDTLRPRARPNGSTRPCSAGSEPGRPPAPSPSSNDSSTSSASITTSVALTAPCIAEPPATPTAPPPKPHRPPTDTPPATTGCATTGSTPPAR